jgi:hypothetical protein
VRNTLRLVLLFVAGLIVLLVVAGHLAGRAVKLDPARVVQDAMTGYGAGSVRHRLAAARDEPWDPIGRANAAVDSVPFDQRAYPLFAEINAILSSNQPPDLGVRPDAEGWGELRAWLGTEDARAAIGLIGSLRDRPEPGFPLGVETDSVWNAALNAKGIDTGPVFAAPTDTPLIFCLLPSLGTMRQASRIVFADAELARLQNDPIRFTDSVCAGLDLLRHGYGIDFMIQQVVRKVIMMDACERIASALEDPTFLDDSDASLLDRALADLMSRRLLVYSTAADRIAFEDLIRRMMEEQGVFVPSAARAVVASLQMGDVSASASSVRRESINADLLRSLDEFERIADLAEQAATVPWSPIPDYDDDTADWESRSDSIPGRAGRRVFAEMIPAYPNSVAVHRRTVMVVLATRIALAAHRHHLRHGQPPASLDAIDPDLLAFDPVDGFTGGRLVYRWTDAGHLVYAAGPDVDDDGGRAIEPPADGEWGRGISDQLLEEKPDGDYILFPPQD